jgi:diguanylate cyclase (GGDEF)-like protein/PAS domain S-box-containing protein
MNSASKSLFKPAQIIMNNLSYRKKFFFLGALSTTALAIILYGFIATLNHVVSATSDKLAGLTLIKPISQSIQSIQIHRGLSAGIIGGNIDEMRQSRALTERLVSENINQFEKVLPTDFLQVEQWQAIQEEWHSIKQSGLNQTLAENFFAHTLVIKHLLDFEAAIAHKYGLTLESSINEFYLHDAIINKLPQALELLGQVRAKGVGILAKKSLSADEKIVIQQLISDLNLALASLNANLLKVATLSNSVDLELIANTQAINNVAQKMINIIEHDIYNRHFSTPPSQFISLATDLINQGYASLYQTLLPASQILLTAKINQAKHSLLTTFIIASTALFITLYFLIGHYFSFNKNIKIIQEAANNFAQGHTSEHIVLNTHDELAQISNSFNIMVDGFNSLLADSQQNALRTQTIINTALDAVIQINQDGVISDWNQQAEVIFGWTKKEVMGEKLYEMIVPEQHRQAHIDGMQRYIKSGLKKVIDTRLEITALRRDGHEFPIELGISHIKTKDGHEFSAFIRDITDKKQSDELIWTQANYDLLTGLPNRHMFQNRLDQEIKNAKRSKNLLGLMFLDLDHFKQVNDSLGHNMGDLLLKETAQRISMCIRDSDTVARLGGDEFTVILPELCDFLDAEQIAKHILHQLALPFQLDDEVVHISTSIGITLYPNDAKTSENLIKNADQAMYQAKNSGHNTFSYFTQTMQDTTIARSNLITAMRNALQNNEFILHYQPIFELPTGKIRKLEALIRWQHPRDGLISPLTFIPLAEETGLIHEIGDWVFVTAAKQLKQWQLDFNPSLKLTINKSPIQFHSDHGHQHWLDTLKELDLASSDITIEITEGLLLESTSKTTQQITDLRLQGFKFAIDDFGTGYSSLSYLKRFKLDFLKIDQSFVKHLTRDSDDAILTKTIIVMAQSLGLKVIAEGIETAEQQQMLTEAGCEFGQGYFLAKPLAASDVEALLALSPPVPELI